MRKQRTTQQNKAIHKYFELLADALNESGWEMKRLLSQKPEIEIPWTPSSIKECIWRPVLRAMTGEDSTTKMNTVDPSEIYQVVDRHISQLTGVHVEFPSEES